MIVELYNKFISICSESTQVHENQNHWQVKIKNNKAKKKKKVKVVNMHFCSPWQPGSSEFSSLELIIIEFICVYNDLQN